MRTIVVGAGLIGLTTAYALQSKGESVTLIDAREGVALETSFANAGLLTPSMPEPWNSPGVYKHLFASLFNPRAAMRLRLHALPSLLGWGVRFLQNSAASRHIAACTDNYYLARYSLQKTAQLTEALELDYCGRSNGTLSVFRDPEGLAAKLTVCEHVAGLGMHYRMLSPSEVVALEPTLASVEDKICQGIHFPDDHHGDSYLFCRELQQHYERAGGHIELDTLVTQLVVEGGRLAGVVTANGQLKADRIVVAAGSHSAKLLASCGIKLPVQPAKGYSVTVEIDDVDAIPALPVIDDSMHACMTPLGNRLRMVGTAEFAGFDTRVDSRRIDSLYSYFEAMLPELAKKTDRMAVRSWAGLRPMSHDGRPFIGATGIEGLYVNSGHGPLGWTMAMGSAHMLADIMTDAKPALAAEPFRLYRPSPAKRAAA